ncbi:serine/threonine-protein kinase [Nonomuraea rhizosphaerae]|uniref:serine/threonine-protein kinase n=1 Tax=Nonomuraea rhizosphaerae TaxID=2665663 RepID=UPI001C5EC466|nr:serine/threonine-protein kinase [Nonomuraea rhizosphaerae]
MLPVEDAPGYRVLDQAGQGGFAIVYRAYQERLDRVVALKVLSVDRVDQRTMRRFQRELQLTGRLTGHPNVVTVFDTGVTHSGKPYIAMDFFENGSLRDKVRREGPLPLAEVLRAGVKLAGALAAVHEAGVLHGDIKPQNILISRYGEPAVADFGVARVVDSSEISATAQAFTPLHAAPEVLTGQPHSASTDIYSLGSTLYHLLAGQPAFHSPTDPSIAPLMYRVLSAAPPPLGRSDVPGPVFEAVLRAMAKQPEARYGSAREFAQRLQALQGELGLPMTDLLGQDAGPSPGRPYPDAGGAVTGGVPTGGMPTAGPTSGGQPTNGPFGGMPPAGGAGGMATGARMPAPSPPPNTAGHPASPPTGHPPSGPYAPGPQHGALTGGPFSPDGSQMPTTYYAPNPAQPAYPPEAAYPPQGGPSGVAAGPAPGRLRVRAAIGAAVAIVVLAGSGFAVYLSRQQAGPVAADPKSSLPPSDAPRDTGTIDNDALAALAPRKVRADDQGTLVELRWALPAAAARYPVVVQRSPVKQNEQAITALEPGATSTRVAGLDPDIGYCFVVGVPLQISQASKVAWSKPVCVRGAVAKTG